jgi:hypothetical protein
LEKQLIWQKVTSIRNVGFSRLGVVWRIGTHTMQKKLTEILQTKWQPDKTMVDKSNTNLNS